MLQIQEDLILQFVYYITAYDAHFHGILTSRKKFVLFCTIKR